MYDYAGHIKICIEDENERVRDYWISKFFIRDSAEWKRIHILDSKKSSVEKNKQV